MLISDCFGTHPQSKLKYAMVRKFVMVSDDNYFLRQCQTKKRVFILLSSWVRTLIGKDGLKSSFCMENVRVIKIILKKRLN